MFSSLYNEVFVDVFFVLDNFKAWICSSCFLTLTWVGFLELYFEVGMGGGGVKNVPLSKTR